MDSRSGEAARDPGDPGASITRPSWRSGHSNSPQARSARCRIRLPMPCTTAACRLALMASLPLVSVVTITLPGSAAAGGSTAGECPASSALPTGDTVQEAAASVACEIKQERVRRELPELRADRRLALAAERHARDMVRRGYFSHFTAGGRGITARVRATGYLQDAAAWGLGETLAWGTGHRSTPAATVAAWMHSGPHRRVLLNPRYREVGIGLELGTPFASSPDSAATFVAELGFVEP